MKLTFSTQIFSADATERTITGQIVPFGKPGNASLGQTVFATGSIRPINLEATKVLLNIGHDRERVVGHLISSEVNPAGLLGTFKIANTTAGSDLLEEAASGIRTGLSIEAEIHNHEVRDNTLHVLDAEVVGVAATTSPAFGENAQITKVAASEPDEADEQETTSEETPLEETNEGVEMTENTAGAVEATDTPVVTAAAPSYVTTTVRHPIHTPGALVEHTLKAHFGDDTSALYLKAASDGDTTDWAGLIPTPQLGQVFNGKTTGVRPAVEAISRGALPAFGKTFELPRIKTAVSAAVAAEGGAFSDTQGEIEYLSVSVSKIAGMQTADVEVIYRSSPAYFDELAMLMADAFAGAQDDLVTAALIANGTADGTAITLPWDGDEIAGFVSRAAASVYAGSMRFPTGIIMTANQWAALMAVNDTTKRPLFNLNGDSINGMGSLDPSAPVGRVMGLPVYVDPHLGTTTADDSIIVVNREAYTFYEGPRAQLRVDSVTDGKISLGYFSFAAVAPKAPAGAFRFNAA